MRVVNDREEKSEPTEFGLLSLVLHSILISLGLSSVFLSPIAILLAHVRLNEPWPKIATVIGALLALVVLDVPLGFVSFGFILGLFAADSMYREKPLGQLFVQVSGLGILIAVVTLWAGAMVRHQGMVQTWHGYISNFVSFASSILQLNDSARELLQIQLSIQAPFLFVSLVVLAIWLSAGLVAHLKWLPEGHAYASKSLRAFSLHPVWSLVFLLLSFGAFLSPSDQTRTLFGGPQRVLSTLMFIQGCAFLSSTFRQKDWRPRLRTVAYLTATTFGFYPVVALGAIAPWWRNRVKVLEEVS